MTAPLVTSLGAPRRSRPALGSPWLLAVLAFAAVWWIIDLGVLKAGTPHVLDDHWEDHLVASRLLAGDGFRTRMIYPPLWGLHDADDSVPVLVHGPLLPLLTAPALAVLGRDRLIGVAAPVAFVALLALIPLFRVGARHFGEPVGAAAALLFTCSPLMLEAVHHAGSVVVGAAMMAWALDLLARPAPRGAAAGVVVGLAYLVRPEALVALPVLGALAWRPSRARGLATAGTHPANGRVLAGLIAGFVVCALPWWVHHARAVGNPLFNLTSYTLVGFWGRRPDMTVMMDFALTPDRWGAVVRAELPHMAPKWIAFFPRAVKHLLFFPSGATGWLALVGLGAGIAEGGATRRLALGALGLALVPLASMTLASHQPLYLVTFAPALAVGAAYGASVAARMLPERARRPRVVIALLLVLLLPSSLRALGSAARASHRLERRIAAERAALAQAFPPGAVEPRVIFSDTPDFAAWITGRPVFVVFRDQFERLYPAQGPGEAALYGLPPARDVAGWFHADFRDPDALGTRVPAGSPTP